MPDAATVKTAERKERLDRIRTVLRKAEAEININATKVTIEGKGIRLSEALQQLQKQSGNVITDMREQLGADVTNPSLDLSSHDQPFFEALDDIAKKAQVATTFFTGDGSIGITGGARRGRTHRHAGPSMKPLIAYSGPFRIELKQLNLSATFRPV